MKKNELYQKLKWKKEHRQMIFATTTSTGLMVKEAKTCGVDFGVVHKESLFGIDGRLPLLARVGYGGNCNEWVKNAAPDILRFAEPMPVIAGVGAAEPYHNIDAVAKQILELGYSGLTHIPSSGGWIGSFGNSIEKAGCGYSKETECIKKWSAAGVFTVAYCFEEEHIKKMADAGASVLALHIPKTRGETYGWSAADNMLEAKEIALHYTELAHLENPDAIMLLEGGDTEKIAFLQELLSESGADGFLGDETVECELLRQSVNKRMGSYKEACIYG